MKAFSVFGVSSSGKTTTVECIIKELKRRNYSVGSIKDIHFENFTMDTPGSNTHRHKAAGSELVIARGLYETNILVQKKLSFNEMAKYFDHDYIVVEGLREEPLPKILTALSVKEIDERLNEWVFAISGVISENMNEYAGLPVINAMTNIKPLVDLIEMKSWESLL